MLLAALVAAGVIAWLHYTGKLTPRVGRLVAAAVLAFVAFRLFRGSLPLAVIAGGASLTLALWDSRPRRRLSLSVDEAREVLGLSPAASADDIRAAHRRLIAQVHPDKGGSPYLSQRVNAARDILLDALNRGDAQAS